MSLSIGFASLTSVLYAFRIGTSTSFLANLRRHARRTRHAGSLWPPSARHRRGERRGSASHQGPRLPSIVSSSRAIVAPTRGAMTVSKPSNIVTRVAGKFRRRRKLGALFIATVCTIVTVLLVHYVEDGGNLPRVDEVKLVPRSHAVRSHGWGSHYIYSGRSHYGGGGRIH